MQAREHGLDSSFHSTRRYLDMGNPHWGSRWASLFMRKAVLPNLRAFAKALPRSKNANLGEAKSSQVWLLVDGTWILDPGS